MLITFTYPHELANFLKNKNKCLVSQVEDQIFVCCRSDIDYFALIQQHNLLQEALCILDATLNFNRVIVSTIKSGKRQAFASKNQAKRMLTIPSFESPSEIELTAECMSYDGACGIILMDGHKGILSNNKITESSKISHPNKWVGLRMSDWWPDDELEKYVSRLLRDGELTNYSYTAILMTGEKALFNVDARLVLWHGELARIVKTNSCVPLI